VINPSEKADCDRWLEHLGVADAPLVVVQTEARREKRGRWPAKRWARLLRAIMERMPTAFALVAGTPEEKTAVGTVVDAVDHPRVRSVAGELPLRRLIALLDRAHSCLSLDTGPAHIAAAVGCPVTVIAGPVHPGLYRPVGLPGRVEVVAGIPPEEWPSDHMVFYRTHRVEAVEPEAVLAAWEGLNRRIDRGLSSS
jgi:heptosyltransferase-2/heptosyltransferase-3